MVHKQIDVLGLEILVAGEAKNVGDAGHRRGFLTKSDAKRSSREC